jgi:hypothetical protein
MPRNADGRKHVVELLPSTIEILLSFGYLFSVTRRLGGDKSYRRSNKVFIVTGRQWGEGSRAGVYLLPKEPLRRLDP